jgi:uncharacterized protein YkvS
VIVPKFKVGDIITTHMGEYGVVEKVEEHILINQNEVVHVYYVKMFCDVPNSSIFFYDNVLTKITE